MIAMVHDDDDSVNAAHASAGKVQPLAKMGRRS